jgi:hypothetical protein
MALDVLASRDDRTRLHPVKPRHVALFGFALLTASSALACEIVRLPNPFGQGRAIST